MKKTRLIALLCLLCLAGCAEAPETPAPTCQVVLEEGEGFTAQSYLAQCVPGGELVFTLRPRDGYTLTGTDWPGGELTLLPGGGSELRLKNVRYSKTVSVFAEQSGTTLTYDPNGGQTPEGKTGPVTVPLTPSHLRWNTAPAGIFQRPGYTLLGWNTAPDGGGRSVGLGSRVTPEEGMILYAQWEKWSDEANFQWTSLGREAAVTAYLGAEKTVCVPAALGGLPVAVIGEGAFAGSGCTQVILPETVRAVEAGAFSNSALESLTLFDTVAAISDYAFSGCEAFRTLHLNAARDPVYSGTYYAAFADKMDRLMSLADAQKIVLFSGSSTRFGYDSARLDEAFPDYDVVNMGVFAYTNALPQLDLIRQFLREGDILLHSPELDAAKRQFCTTSNLDAAFFSMIEADYDLLARLDLRDYGQVFTAFQSYQTAREGMEARSYGLSPADFDEDGNPVTAPSYNLYGDYILYRPNSPEQAPIYGLPVKYTVDAYPLDYYLGPLNRVIREFQAMGVRYYITYSPRNRLAVSEDSTPEAVEALDAYFRAHLAAPVISRLADSLISGVYLYGTDNHLSTEGVELRTERIIAELTAQLEQEGGI